MTKQNPINLTIPPGMRIITIGFGENIEEADDAVRAAFEKAEKDGIASIPMTEREDVRKATGLDILRMRGTPIEMIYSAIAAEDFETAQAMFRTSILEYVHEKIDAIGWAVGFIHSQQLHRKDEQLAFIVDIDHETTGKTIALTPEHDTLPFQGSGIAKVCNVGSGRRITKPIGDDGSATVMNVIEDISDAIFAEASQGISNAKLADTVVPIIRIVVDLGTFHIAPKDGGIEAEVNIPMTAFSVDVN